MMHYIKSDFLTIEVLAKVLKDNSKLALADEAKLTINKCYQFLKDKVSGGDQTFYGINTGFGSLCDVSISKADLAELQSNLVKSHAFGIGDLVPLEIVKTMLFLKVQNLAFGYSGISEKF